MRAHGSTENSPKVQAQDDQQWEKLKDLFDKAINLSDQERDAFVEEVSAGDPELGAKLKRLVEQHLKAPKPFLPTPSPGEFVPGQIVAGRYRILWPLGRGGMGEVYLAYDTTDLKRNVALKFVAWEAENDPLIRSRLRLEANAAAGVDHPYICKIYEIGEFESKPYIAMEYVDGQTLRERLVSGAIPAGEGFSWSCEIVEALAAAHGRGIVHGDLKPSNLMVTRSGHIKLMDFGIAHRVEQPPDMQITARTATHTATGTSQSISPQQLLAGAPLYMSPEQLRGKPATKQSDIFSLGLILYEIFTGVHPFLRETAQASFGAILYEDASTAPRADSIPEELQPVIWRMLAKSCSDRYSSADEILLDLKCVTGTAVEAGNPSKQPHAIAVLPFSDLSPAKDQEYFCHGIAEELINALGAIDGLRVASRASSFRFRNNEFDTAEIGRRLKVKAIVDGSVRKSGDRVRISVSLIDVATGFQRWSERYDRALTDIFEIQDDIATSIVKRFHLFGTEEEKPMRSATPNIAAYELYLKGRYQWNQRTETALRASIDCYHQAIALDSCYATPYSGLADSYVTLGLYGAAAPADTMILARSAAEKALQIDPTSAEAMTSLACVRCVYEWNWEAGERDFRRTIQTHPQYSTAHQWFANHCLGPLGRFDEAHAELRQALEIDAASLATAASIGVIFYFERKFDEAIEQQLRILKTAPGFGIGYYFLGQAYTGKGMLDDALRALQRAVDLSGRSSESLTMLGRAQAEVGRTAEARTILNELLERSNRAYVSPVLVAILAIALKEFDRALEYLHRAVVVRATDLIWIGVRPAFDPVRTRPDFVRICEQVGLIPPGH